MGKKFDYLCFSGLGGGDEITFVISADSTEQIRDKYPMLSVLAPGETVEEKLQLPLPANPAQKYKERISQVPLRKKIDIEDIPKGQFVIQYAEPRGMNGFSFKHINGRGDIKYLRVFAKSLSEIINSFPELEYMPRPELFFTSDHPYALSVKNQFCLEFSESIKEFLSKITNG